MHRTFNFDETWFVKSYVSSLSYWERAKIESSHRRRAENIVKKRILISKLYRVTYLDAKVSGAELFVFLANLKFYSRC